MNTLNFNTEQQAAAKSLAIAYDAYNDAVNSMLDDKEHDNSAIMLWGETLRIAQKETGVTLLGDDAIALTFTLARRALHQFKREAELASCEIGLALLEDAASTGDNIPLNEIREAARAVGDAKYNIAVAKHTTSRIKAGHHGGYATKSVYINRDIQGQISANKVGAICSPETGRISIV